MSHDARELLDAICAGAVHVGGEWDVRRLAAAAAEAAASLLTAVDAAPEQFTGAFARARTASMRAAAAESL